VDHITTLHVYTPTGSSCYCVYTKLQIVDLVDNHGQHTLGLVSYPCHSFLPPSVQDFVSENLKVALVIQCHC